MKIPDKVSHISVCICTYKRPELLMDLLRKLQNQETGNSFTYSIVVVDNDKSESAKTSVDEMKSVSQVAIDYYVEPEQNIALARNKAVENAKGDYFAFIDDDEFPTREWLLRLFRASIASKSTGVLGPVIPYYLKDTPNWVMKSGTCERKKHATGTILQWAQTRTGNVLMNRNLLEGKQYRFGAEYGRSGGEDIEYFKTLIEDGHRFSWCDEAPVYEIVLPERWSKRYHLEKNMRIGGLTGEKIRKGKGKILIFCKVITGSMLYLTVFPLLVIFGEHRYMRCMMKIAYNVGLLSGLLGFVIIRNRKD
jgi:succinoglycan biosynthesis protein ExoM